MTIDEELDLLADNIRRLKIEYEIFFNGGSKKPPTDLRSRVEFSLKKYSDTQKLTSHQRFRYNTLAAKFSVFSDLWRTRLRAREEGLDRRMRPAEFAPTETVSPAGREVLYKEDVLHPESEPEKILRLFEALKEYKDTYRDPSKLPSLEAFRRFIDHKTRQLMDAERCNKVRFMVVRVQDQVKFQAIPVRQSETTAETDNP